MSSTQPSPTRPSVSFVVPALNEARLIEKTVQTILQAVKASQVSDYEIVQVDDGSTDGTDEIMDRLAREIAKVRVVHNPRNLGFGGAYKQGVAAARCDYVMIIAGDNLMPASSITAIINRLGDADIILPYMSDANRRPLVRRVCSWGFSRLVNLLFGYRIHYYNSMVPRRELLNRITIAANGYSLQAECIVKMLKGGATYAELGVPHGHGVVKAGSYALRPKNVLNVFKGLFKLIQEIRRPGAVPKPSETPPARKDS